MNNALDFTPDTVLFKKDWLPLEQAIQKVARFEHEFGEAHLALACHAALASILTPELVNLIRINFLEPSVEWIAECDLLLSSLCQPIDQGVYEIEPQIRQVLLVALQTHLEYGPEKLEEIAHFLYRYSETDFVNELPLHIKRTYQWISGAYINPDATIQNMFDLLKNVRAEDFMARMPDYLHIGKTLAMIANPLEMTGLQVELEDLVSTAQLSTLYWTGDKENLLSLLPENTDELDEITHALTKPVANWLATSEFVTSDERSFAPLPISQSTPVIEDTVRIERKPVTIFCSYAYEDEELQRELARHLAPLQARGLITYWHDPLVSFDKIEDHKKVIDEYLNTAQIILLLISPDFKVSEYHYEFEMKRAMERHEQGDARVIPIMLRPIYWPEPLFGKLQRLPMNGSFITTWEDRGLAFAEVVTGIERAVEELQVLESLPKISRMTGTHTNTEPIEIFVSYALNDQPFLIELEKYLSHLRKQGLIITWSDQNISASIEWAQEISKHLMRANIILLLVSSDFLTSNYCYGIEMQRAMERHQANEARVIPIIVRPCEWSSAPFAPLQVLPKNAKPITQWNNQDAAIADVANGIQRVIEDIKEPQMLPEIGDQMEATTLPIEVFLAYAHEDEAYLIELEKHLSYLSNQGLIKLWSDRQILPGAEWRQVIDMRLRRAGIILLLISPHFLNSNYSGLEMQRALQRHQENEARVIPIIVQPCEWMSTPFAHLQVLPTDANPITNWSDQDEAFFDVVRSIHRIVEDLKTLLELQQIKQLKRPTTIFISYASSDLEEVRDLQLRLNMRGVRCWRDVDDMSFGNHTESEIALAIEHDVDAIALFITPSFLKSEFIWRVEVLAALRRHKLDPQFHIVPILLDVTFAEVRQFCYNRNITDITNFNGLSLTESGDAGIYRVEQNKKRNEAARRILHSAFTGRLRRINANRNYEPSLFLRTFVFAPPTDNLDLALDWLPLVREKEQRSTLQEWEEILWPALIDVKHTISEKIASRRIHLFVKGILPLAIALGFVFRESIGMTLLLEGQKETWSTETRSSEKEPLHNEWIYNDNGDQQVAVIEVATSRSTKQGVAATLSGISLTPGYHIRLTSSEFSRESVKDATHARAIAQQVGHVCQNLCYERGVRHLHLFVAIPVELAVLIGHQLNELCPVTVYEFKNDERVYTPIGILS